MNAVNTYASTYFLIIDERLSCVCSILGCGDYEELMRYRFQKSVEANVELDLNNILNTILLTTLQKYDPIHSVHKFGHRPVLLLNGGSDLLVPVQCNQRFFDSMAQICRPKEKFIWIVEKDARHELTSTMKAQCKEWIQQYINKDRS